MQKNSVAKIALYLIVILVLNVLYFNMIENHTPARWVSYAGIHMSYLLLCVSSLSFSRFDSGGSVVHVYPKMMVAYGYFMASLICGVILILINNSTITFPVVVHAIIVGFYIFHYLLLMNAEAHTEANEQRSKMGAIFLRDCSSRLKMIMAESPSRDVRWKVERLHNTIIGAMPSLNPSVSGLEEQIVSMIDRVGNAVRSSDVNLESLIKEAVMLVKERERIIALSK